MLSRVAKNNIVVAAEKEVERGGGGEGHSREVVLHASKGLSVIPTEVDTGLGVGATGGKPDEAGG